MQMFGRGKLWQIWQIVGGSPNLTIQILKMLHEIPVNKVSKQAGIHPSFTCQKFSLPNIHTMQ